MPLLPTIFHRIGSSHKSTKSTPDSNHFALGHPHLSMKRANPFLSRLHLSSAKPESQHDETNPKIVVRIESPPLVCYGSTHESSGALLSGVVLLNAGSACSLGWSKFTMTLQSELLIKRPVYASCSNCSTIIDVINTWVFISSPTSSARDTFHYPFSFLLPGHLPASNNNSLVKISYALVATAITDQGHEIKHHHPITFERAILPGPERVSLRVFPPTNLTATAKIPSVVYFSSEFPVSLRLDGVVSTERGTQWRQRKVVWRIDELSSLVSPPCSAHAAKLKADTKGVFHEDSRVIASGETKQGWKSDFHCSDGHIETELTVAIPAQNRAASDLDLDARGIHVQHFIIMEIIVVEEPIPVKSRKLLTPPGAARILRMQFKLNLSSGGGLGVSWDEETPPMYESVPPPPPVYGPEASLSSDFMFF